MWKNKRENAKKIANIYGAHAYYTEHLLWPSFINTSENSMRKLKLVSPVLQNQTKKLRLTEVIYPRSHRVEVMERDFISGKLSVDLLYYA